MHCAQDTFSGSKYMHGMGSHVYASPANTVPACRKMEEFNAAYKELVVLVLLMALLLLVVVVVVVVSSASPVVADSAPAASMHAANAGRSNARAMMYTLTDTSVRVHVRVQLCELYNANRGRPSRRDAAVSSRLCDPVTVASLFATSSTDIAMRMLGCYARCNTMLQCHLNTWFKIVWLPGDQANMQCSAAAVCHDPASHLPIIMPPCAAAGAVPAQCPWSHARFPMPTVPAAHGAHHGMHGR